MVTELALRPVSVTRRAIDRLAGLCEWVRGMHRRRLSRNAFWNLLGYTVPMFAALFCIPVLIDRLGTERFGFITLAWVVIGYFSLFDMGLGRALTHLISRRLGAGDPAEVPALVWTALLLMGGLSVVMTLVTFVSAPWLAVHVLTIPAPLASEAVTALRLLALTLPAVVTVAGLRGVLEAHQRFALISAIRVPMGLYSFVAPLGVSLFSRSLVHVVAALAVGRVIGWGVFTAATLRTLPDLGNGVRFRGGLVRPLLRFGGWMTVSNLIAPVMLYMDRFAISALISLESVAWYTTPFEVVTKLLVIPAAVMGVLFPALSRAGVADHGAVTVLYRRTLLAVGLLMGLPVVLLVWLAKPGLTLWLGVPFAANAFRILQILSIGVFVGAMAQPSFTLIHSMGRPKLTALIHMAELPIYLGYLWFGIVRWGILGAAWAWLLRVSLSCVVLTLLARRLLKTVPTPSGISPE